MMQKRENKNNIKMKPASLTETDRERNDDVEWQKYRKWEKL